MLTQASIFRTKFQVNRFQGFFRALAALFFAAAAAASVLLSVADHLAQMNEPEQVRRALNLTPGNAAYHVFMAEDLEERGRDSRPELEAAAALNPLDAATWIRLAFQAETIGNYASAERDFLRAASVDRTYDPAWSLANFYYRRGRLDRFWDWIGRALAVGSPNLDTLFRLCWDVAPSIRPVQSRLPPRRPDELLRYAAFLVNEGHMPESAPVVTAAARIAGPDDTPMLQDYCRRMLRQDPDSSVRVWNVLSDRRLIPFSPLSPRSGPVVTNGDFSPFPASAGLDWSTFPGEGVAVTPGAFGGVSIRLSGTQPGQCRLISQWMPTEPGRKYSISYEYQMNIGENSETSGLLWTAADSTSELTGATTPAWRPGRIDFTAAAGATELQLAYKRPIGSPTAELSVGIRRVTGIVVNP